MTDDKIITLRFRAGNAPDMELYRELECEKNCLGISMPVYVKGVLQEHFSNNPSKEMEEELTEVLKEELDRHQQKLQDVIRQELMSLSSVLLATLVRMGGTDTVSSEVQACKPVEQFKDNLPEYSDELPAGFDDVLGKMM